MRSPAFLAAVAALDALVSAEPVACPSLISTIALATPGALAASAVAAVLMPTSCGLPPEGAGTPFTAARRVA